MSKYSDIKEPVNLNLPSGFVLFSGLSLITTRRYNPEVRPDSPIQTAPVESHYLAR